MTNELQAITLDGRRVILKPDGTWSFRTGIETNDDPEGFRGIAWGTPYEKVITAETDLLKNKGNGQLIYHTQLAGLNCDAVYTFVHNILVRGAYEVTTNHLQTNQYLISHDQLKQLLIDKYGSPNQDRTIWNDDTFMKNTDRLGFALSRGDVSFYTRWETVGTDIVLSMTSGELDINTSIDYTSKELGHLLERQHSDFARGV